MKVKPESATTCSCGGNFIYFAGTGTPSRICVSCLGRQKGIDMCGMGYIDDMLRDMGVLEDFEDIEYEYFDLSSDNIPF